MKCYINTDTYKEIALKTEDNLREICRKYSIEITDDIKDADIIFSIGGDGTFLESARMAESKEIIGINCATLGFLTEIRPQDIEKTIKEILDGNYHIEKRMMLEGEIIRKNGEKIKIPQALNEISVSKNTFGVVRFDAIINDKLINSYTADGIIISTPTGSPAYNLSCGGPIVEPTAEIITLTPIAPHTILNRSIVLSDESVIKIRITELRGDTKAYALYDGNPIEVASDDIVKIRKSKNFTKIIKLNSQSFIDTIRENIS